MAILDRENAFSQSQALSGTAAIPSTDIIDLSQIRQLGAGKGEPFLQLNFEATPGGTTPTMTVQIETDDNAAFASPTIALVVLSAIAAANFGASRQYTFNLPRQGLERFMRLQYTMGGTSPTSVVSAHLVVDVQEDIKYASGFVVA